MKRADILKITDGSTICVLLKTATVQILNLEALNYIPLAPTFHIFVIFLIFYATKETDHIFHFILASFINAKRNKSTIEIL